MDDRNAAARRARRAWLLKNHPDRGGDPDMFVEGLARESRARDHDDHRPTVHRTRSVARTVKRLCRSTRRFIAARRRRSPRVR
ncbi:hypothetical protein [Nakamurella sp. UYEF19]|uniref:hypothetical protein n=1 Tax=Nakamurella sp. UYEF19 TaxID=1756392 RepID=UPI003396A62C